MPRMRTDREVITEIKAADPESRFTRHALRKLAIIEGKIPFVQIGAKRLYDVDTVMRFLSGEYVPPQEELQTGKIRKLF